MSTGKITETLKVFNREFPDEARKVLESSASKLLKHEAKTICAESREFKISSNFKVEDHFAQQTDELQKKAPLILQFAKDVALNPRNKRSAKRKDEDCMPSILNAISSLLYTRNRLMSLNPFINTCILRRGQAKKVAFERFHRIGMCISYSNIMTKLTEIGKGFDGPVKEWMKSIGREDTEFKEAVSEELLSPQPIPIQLSSAPVPTTSSSPLTLSGKFGELSVSHHNFSQDITLRNKFMEIGDNVDVNTKRRHYTISRSNKDLHLFNLIAVRYD